MTKSGDLDVKVLDVTPLMAAEWLGQNVNNRNIRQARVHELMRELRAGRWQLNGETVKIGDDGSLRDGQHRLTAIVETGITAKMVVAFGIPEEAMTTIDVGAARTSSDMLRIDGSFSDPALVSALAIKALAYRLGGNAGSTFYMDERNFRIRPSKAQVLEYASAHRDSAQRSALIARRACKQFRVSPSVVGMAAHLTEFVSIEGSQEFFELFASGEGFSGMGPLMARNRLIKLGMMHRLSETAQACILLDAWNQTFAKKNVRTLKTNDIRMDPDVPRWTA